MSYKHAFQHKMSSEYIFDGWNFLLSETHLKLWLWCRIIRRPKSFRKLKETRKFHYKNIASQSISDKQLVFWENFSGCAYLCRVECECDFRKLRMMCMDACNFSISLNELDRTLVSSETLLSNVLLVLGGILK